MNQILLNTKGFGMVEMIIGWVLTGVILFGTTSLHLHSSRSKESLSRSLSSMESVIGPVKALKLDLKRAISVAKVEEPGREVVSIQIKKLSVGGLPTNQTIFYELVDESCNDGRATNNCKTLIRSEGVLDGPPVIRFTEITHFNWCYYDADPNPLVSDPLHLAVPFYNCSELSFSLPSLGVMAKKRFAFEFSKYGGKFNENDTFLQSVVDIENIGYDGLEKPLVFVR